MLEKKTRNKKEFANDLKTIYQAPSEKAALEHLERVTAKWEKDYPNAMKSRHTNWDVISPIFKFSAQVRKVIEPVFIRNVCGFSSIILLQTRQKSAGGLSPGKDF